MRILQKYRETLPTGRIPHNIYVYIVDDVSDEADVKRAPIYSGIYFSFSGIGFDCGSGSHRNEENEETMEIASEIFIDLI